MTALVDRLVERNGHALPEVQPITKKIAIVGKAPSSRMLAPYDDPEWEIWGLSDLYSIIPRWDRWFEIHDFDTWGAGRWTDEHWKFLETDHGRTLYVKKAHPRAPHAKVYPKEAIVEKFGNYFTNSVSWMIALAIAEGATEIGLWGVDMAVQGPGNSEYAHQRPSCEWILGIAAGAGIKICVPEESDLLKCRKLYGFESTGGAFAAKIKVREKELTDEVKQLDKQLRTMSERRLVLMGAIDDLQWVKQWS